MIEFRILGPVEVLAEGRPIEIPQARLRALLAILLLNANEVVSTDRLIDALWGEQPPSKAGNALQVSVSRLRKLLPNGGEPFVQTRYPGYLIELDPVQLDLRRFETLAGEGRESLRLGEHVEAARLLREALAVWHGPALADLTSEAFVQREAERLEESRLAALELRIEADLATGEHAGLVAELESLVAVHPYREGFRGQLMLALYRAGRQAEALEAYQLLRQELVDDLGIEPSRSLQQLERAILQQDPTLELPETAAARLAEARAARRVDSVSAVVEASRAEARAIESELTSSLAELQDARERTESVPATAGEAGAVCPFKGLSAFDEDDEDFFFGRERLVSEVVARSAGSRLVCITGPSGSGKSSLLRAGLIPALARGILPGSETWMRILLRPGEHPLNALRSGLEEPGEARRVVAVDQLEEAFTLCDDETERTTFLDELAGLALRSPRTLVVTAIRADFYGHLTSSPALASLLGTGTVLVGAMSEEELRRAIEGPSRRARLRLEPGLAETLVAEALDEPGALPLLQTSLLELWKERDGATLTLRAYGRTGGLRGAVAQLAENAYDRLEPEEQRAARPLFLRLADEEAGTIVRRRVARAELEGPSDDPRRRALSALVESRLLIVDDETVEVAHEALFREWPRLRAWLEEDAESRVVRRALAAAASTWAAGGRDPGDLYRGARLASTLSWAAEHAEEIAPLEGEFLEAARTQAEAESERQKRANRRLRGLLGSVLVLLAVAVAAGVVALAQRSTARESATEATAQRLGAQGLVEGDLDRSLLLARQAVDLDASARTHGNLLAALLRSPAAVRVLRPLSGRLLGITASEKTRAVVVGSNEGQVALVDPRGWTTIAAVDGEVGFPSADGRVVWIYRGGGEYALLDATTGRQIHAGRLPGSEGARAWHVSSDFRVVSIVGDDNRVTLWSRENGTKLREIAAPQGAELIDAFLSPDGGRVLTVTVPAPAPFNPDEIRSMTFTVWDAASGEAMRTLPDQPPFPAFAFSGEGSVLAVAGDDFAVRLHDLESGAVRELAGGHTAPVQGISFSTDGTKVATGADDKLALVWDARSGEILERLAGHDGRVFGPAFGPDGLLYTASLDGSLIVWDLEGDRRLGRPFAGPRTAPGIVPAFDVSPDGRSWAVGGDGGTVQIRDGRTLRTRATLRIPDGSATSVAFSPDGRLLATGTDGAEVLLWDTAGWTRAGQPLPGVEAPPEDGRTKIVSLAFSSDGRLLAAGTDEERPVAGSPDPDLDGRVYVWETESRSLALPAIDSPGHTFDVALGSDGSRVAAIVEAPDWDPKPELEPMGWAVAWSLEDGSELYRVDADGDGFGRPGGLAFSPDGALLAVGGGDGNVRFFDARGGEEIGSTVRASAGWVLSIGFAGDSRRLVTGATDGTVRLFDVGERFQIGTSLPGIDNFWVRARFTPDGGHVLSLHDNGRGFRWEASPAGWSQRACAIAGGTLSEEEWERFLPGRTYAPACT